MPFNEGTVHALRVLWPDVMTYLDTAYRQTAVALAMAEDINTVRQLQGKMRALTGYMNLPEAMALALAADTEGAAH